MNKMTSESGRMKGSKASKANRSNWLTRSKRAVVKDFAGFMSIELSGTIAYIFIGTAGEGLGFLVDSSGGRSTLPGSVPFFTWALSVGIYIAGGYSGGQLNGSVTVAMATVGMDTVGKMKRHKTLIYFAAQFWGGLLGSALTAGLYWLVLSCSQIWSCFITHSKARISNVPLLLVTIPVNVLPLTDPIRNL